MRYRLADLCFERLVAARSPLVDRYHIVLVLADLALDRAAGRVGIYAFADAPERGHLTRVLTQLEAGYRIGRDPDFGRGIYQVNRLPDVGAEEACCLVDPFCGLSHLSAMRHFGLTDRIPAEVTVTRPAPAQWKEAALALAKADIATRGEALRNFPDLKPARHAFPARVRKMPVRQHVSTRPPAMIEGRDGFVRTVRVEELFVQMLTEPDLCGGIAHILEVWRDEAPPRLDKIVAAIDRLPQAVVKVRAGYVIDEILGIAHPILDRWATRAQRGGSRKLDPAAPYRPVWSERWQLSLNAEIPE